MTLDLYPSRVGAEEAIFLSRKDPVVYGGHKEGPLSAEQLTSYEQNGYVLVESLFNEEEVEIMCEHMKELMKAEKSRDVEHVIKEPSSNEIRSVFDIHRDHGFFQALSNESRIVQIAEQILGSQLYIMQSRINFKPGFKGKEFYWHSDFETWHVEDGMPQMRAVSCSIILTDNFEYNGPLMLIPGSHQWYISCPGLTGEDNFKTSLKMQESGVPDHQSLARLVDDADGRIDRATGPAGSVLFFDCNTMHGSGGNISPFPRSNVFFVFNSIENQLTAPFGGTKPRPEFLANRQDVEPLQASDRTFDPKRQPRKKSVPEQPVRQSDARAV